MLLAGKVMRKGQGKWGRQMDGGQEFKLLLLATSINPGLLSDMLDVLPVQTRGRRLDEEEMGEFWHETGDP